MARVYNAKTPYALPHMMFVIDRSNNDKIYYVNSQMFRFHQDFANAQYLSLKRGEDFFRDVYTNDRRRLIVGTIAWQSPVGKFTFEYWDGDLVTPQMVGETYSAINKTFFTDISFKPNSTRQENISSKLNIPNAYIKNANELFRKFDGYWFEFETTLTDYKYSPCTLKCLDEKAKIAPAVYGADQFRSPPSNLSVTKLLSLSEIRAKDSNIFGSKAANLGELVHSRPTGFSVPAGFGIPFIYYKRFMESNRFFDVIDNLMNDQEFVHNPSVRRKKLDEFRRQIQSGKFDEKLRSEIIAKWKTSLGGKPIYVRSSSNAEDAGNFSGAGLYTSVENVTEADKIIEAIKTVWASVWNFKAYEARERNFVDQENS